MTYRPLHGPELPDLWVWIISLAALFGGGRLFRWW